MLLKKLKHWLAQVKGRGKGIHRATIRPYFPGHVLFFGPAISIRAYFVNYMKSPEFWPNLYSVKCQTDRYGNVSHVSLALETVKWEIYCPCGYVGLGSLFHVFMDC